MRRADLEVKELSQLEDILKACTAVHLGAADEAGMFIVPLNFGYRLEGEQLTLYVHSAGEGRKVRAFQKGGTVAFEMDCEHALRTADCACDYSYTYRSIMGSGTIRQLTQREEKRVGLNAIMEHMTGRGWEIPEEGIDHTRVFAVAVQEWTGKSNQGRS